MDGLVIRDAAPSDVAAIARLNTIAMGYDYPEDRTAEKLAVILADSRAKILVAELAGRVAGYAGLQVILDEGTVTNIAVRPDCRRQGVAGQLLQVFLDFAQGNRLAFLTLEVRASNYDAIALYGSRGFRSVGRRKNYYERPREDAVIMTREFSGGGTSAEGEEARP